MMEASAVALERARNLSQSIDPVLELLAERAEDSDLYACENVNII